MKKGFLIISITVFGILTASIALAHDCGCFCVDGADRATVAGEVFTFDGDLKNAGDWNLASGACASACTFAGMDGYAIGVECDLDDGGYGKYIQPLCNPCTCSCTGSCSVSGRVYPSSSEPDKVPKNSSSCESVCNDLCSSQGSGCSYLESNCTEKAVVDIPVDEAPPTTGTPPIATPPVPDKVELQPPFGQAGQSGDKFIQEIIGVLINWVLGIVGSIALLMFVIGGFVWLTSAGNPDKIKTGKNILVWSVLGLVVIFASYAITRVILEAILG